MAFSELVYTPNLERGGNWHELTKPLTFHGSHGFKVTVPKYFETDGASVPRLLRVIFPQFGKHTKATVLHDWLYVKASGNGSRFIADAMLLRAMVMCDVPQWQAWSMYVAVRLFGWLSFKKR